MRNGTQSSAGCKHQPRVLIGSQEARVLSDGGGSLRSPEMDDGLTTPKHRKNHVKLLKIHFACNPVKLGFSANNHLRTTLSLDLHIGVAMLSLT